MDFGDLHPESEVRCIMTYICLDEVGKSLRSNSMSRYWALTSRLYGRTCMRSPGHEHTILFMLMSDFSVPPNVRFEVDDVEEEWTYSQPFEYIHSRFMTAAIDDWDKYIKRCYE